MFKLPRGWEAGSKLFTCLYRAGQILSVLFIIFYMNFYFKKKLNAAKVSRMGRVLELTSMLNCDLWCRKPEIDTASPLWGQTDFWRCTLKAVLYTPLPYPTPTSHIWVQLNFTALVEEGTLAWACALLIYIPTMFYHLSDEMAETGNRTGESQSSFRIYHWRLSSGSNNDHMHYSQTLEISHGTNIHAEGITPTFWWPLAEGTSWNGYVSGIPNHLYGAWQWIQHSSMQTLTTV